MADVVESAWQELCERDDRTSPEDYPDMCLITQQELAEFMSRARLSQAGAGGVREVLVQRLCQRHGELLAHQQHGSAFIEFDPKDIALLLDAATALSSPATPVSEPSPSAEQVVPTPQQIHDYLHGVEEIKRQVREANPDLATPPAPSGDEDGDDPACPVCGCEERGQGGYLSCECPATPAKTPSLREALEEARSLIEHCMFNVSSNVKTAKVLDLVDRALSNPAPGHGEAE